MSLSRLALPFALLCGCSSLAGAQAGVTKPSPELHPWDMGVLFQGGKGVTDNRDDFRFAMAGIHAGKTLTGEHGPGPLRGSFEVAAELFPFWQSYTPTFLRATCYPEPNAGTTQIPVGSQPQAFCTPYYRVGGTFTGVSLTPAIFRWNFAGTHRITPWFQAAGGLLWTNHKYPAYGSTALSLQEDGTNGNASVWNFTPQGGVGVHWYLTPTRSLDLGANGVHISSASLGDRNPGVNASVQFSIGYSWWSRSDRR